jgi:hypothetical protein
VRSLIFDADIQLARAVAEGALCLECQRTFVEPHGEAVACRGCWRSYGATDKARYRRAWHDVTDNVDYRRHLKKSKEKGK